MAGDLQALAGVDLVIAVDRAIQSDHVGEEGGIEQAGLQRPGQIDPELDIVEVRLPRLRVAPQSVLDVRNGVHDEGIEQQGGHRGSTFL